MISLESPCYTLINDKYISESFTEVSLKFDLENGDIKKKIEALKTVICLMLNGEKLPNILIAVIRFILPSENHTIKKLLIIFWEIVPKTSSDGKLLNEMLLVCDAFRKDLTHCNEYIRGSMLRFLCKLKEPELLEPLIPSVRACLEHRHAYVRRNAVFAVHKIYSNFDYLIPDAPNLVFNYLETEKDFSCKRNAFIMLMRADQEKALNYLTSCIDQVSSFGDILQLIIIELIYKVCHINPGERSKFLRCIYNLLNSSSPSVRYEAAGTLITLSKAPTAIKAAASCYIDLIIKESDNNVKLIVLDCLINMNEQPGNEKILQELIMDILRVLSSTDLEVKQKTLALTMDLISSQNVEDLILVLKKEVLKTANYTEQEESSKYRQLLIRTLHSCCVKFPDTATSVIPVLIEFLSDAQEVAAIDVLIFFQEIAGKCKVFQSLIIEKLLEVFLNIQAANVYRATLWIFSAFASSLEEIKTIMTHIRQGIGKMPIVESEIKKSENVQEEPKEIIPAISTQKLVTADGTYATQSAFMTESKAIKYTKHPHLRGLLLEGNFFLGAVLATALTKLALHFCTFSNSSQEKNSFCAEVMLIISSMLHLGRSGLSAKALTEDDADHFCRCLIILSERSPLLIDIFIKGCNSSLSHMLQEKYKGKQQENSIAKKFVNQIDMQVDEPLTFMQLVDENETSNSVDIFENSLIKALGYTSQNDVILGSSKLNKVTQLTGFSDPVYAEAYVHVNQYDIILDVLLVNQTGDTLQNCTLELAMLGDLRLVDKPAPMILGPFDFCNIKAHVKVASIENGIIFGNIVYDVSSSTSDRNIVVLDDIHIDIVNYIIPGVCTDTEFRQMWAEFEWENKLSVNTSITDLREYLNHIIKCTNMYCLTPKKALQGDCKILAANLYARSIFGESALANVSIEISSKKSDAPVTGHIRIRSKTQGMALSLGDKINLTEKALRASGNKNIYSAQNKDIN